MFSSINTIAINEDWLVFQEMQVDTQPFCVNTIQLTRKKVLIRPEMADKGMSKASSLVILARRTYRKEGLLGRLRTRRLPCLEAPEGRLNWAAEHGSLTRASWTIRALGADRSMLKQTVRLTQSDSPPMARGVSFHTKKKGDVGAKHI
jgi:hypothetical protein